MDFEFFLKSTLDGQLKDAGFAESLTDIEKKHVSKFCTESLKGQCTDKNGKVDIKFKTAWNGLHGQALTALMDFMDTLGDPKIDGKLLQDAQEMRAVAKTADQAVLVKQGRFIDSNNTLSAEATKSFNYENGKVLVDQISVRIQELKQFENSYDDPVDSRRHLNMALAHRIDTLGFQQGGLQYDLNDTPAFREIIRKGVAETEAIDKRLRENEKIAKEQVQNRQLIMPNQVAAAVVDFETIQPITSPENMILALQNIGLDNQQNKSHSKKNDPTIKVAQKSSLDLMVLGADVISGQIVQPSNSQYPQAQSRIGLS